MNNHSRRFTAAVLATTTSPVLATMSFALATMGRVSAIVPRHPLFPSETGLAACCAESLQTDVFTQLRPIPVGLLRCGELSFRAEQAGALRPSYLSFRLN